jgi:ABC-type molybdate transport system substrate-binding protein
VSYINATTTFVIHCTNNSSVSADQTTTLTVTSATSLLNAATHQMATVACAAGDLFSIFTGKACK